MVFRCVFKKIFKAKIEGLENLKKAGDRALIITNHTSYMDVLLISAFVDKKIVFAISDKLLNKVFVKFMTNLVEIKPLDPVSPFAVKDMAEELIFVPKLYLFFPYYFLKYLYMIYREQNYL